MVIGDKSTNMKGIPTFIGIILAFTIMNLISIGESRLFMTPNNWLMNNEDAAEKLESVSHRNLGAMKSDQLKKSPLQMIEEQNPITFLLVPKVSCFLTCSIQNFICFDLLDQLGTSSKKLRNMYSVSKIVLTWLCLNKFF